MNPAAHGRATNVDGSIGLYVSSLFDQLEPAPVATLHLSTPTDERALQVAQAFQADVTVGYATSTAFVAAFRRATGSAPGRYFNEETLRLRKRRQ